MKDYDRHNPIEEYMYSQHPDKSYWNNFTEVDKFFFDIEKFYQELADCGYKWSEEKGMRVLIDLQTLIERDIHLEVFEEQFDALRSLFNLPSVYGGIKVSEKYTHCSYRGYTIYMTIRTQPFNE